MPKNLTFLTKIYHLNQKAMPKLISRYVMPLFELKIFDIKPFLVNYKRQTLFKRPFIYRTSKQPKDFTQVVVLNASISESNCRRNKLINSKRDAISKFLNANHTSGIGYGIILSKANYFAPEQQLISQLGKVFSAQKQKIMNEKDLRKNHFNKQISKVPISQVLQNVVIKKWSSFLYHHFPGKHVKSMFLHQLQNSYLQVFILNFYKIRYSKNPEQLYEDMRDFDKMLSKFNFIRFFMTSNQGNGERNQKNCESFIRKLKWRTVETEKYLLFLTRNCSWQRNCITVQNFVHLYDTQFRKEDKTQENFIKAHSVR